MARSRSSSRWSSTIRRWARPSSTPRTTRSPVWVRIPEARPSSELTNGALQPCSAPVDRHDLGRLGRASQRDRPRLRDREPPVGRRGLAGEDLVAVGERRDPGGLVHALAREVPADLGRPRGVYADPDLGCEPVRPAVLGQTPLDRDRAREGLVGRIEPDEEPVARADDLLALVLGEQRPERLVVPSQHALPRLVPQRLDQVRRSLDVGEHERLLDPAGYLLASELPRQQLLDLLDDERAGRAGERRLAHQLILHAGCVQDSRLQELALVPVEYGGRDRDARAGTDAPVTVDACLQRHRSSPLIGPSGGKRGRWPPRATTRRSWRTARRAVARPPARRYRSRRRSRRSSCPVPG